MNKTRDIYRKERARHIKRKKNIIHKQNDYWSYKYDGQLSKGKIHCSCWMCSGKTRIHGWSIKDLKSLDKIKNKLKDSLVGDELS